MNEEREHTVSPVLKLVGGDECERTTLPTNSRPLTQGKAGKANPYALRTGQQL
jgi:hypothetical protein